MTDAAQRLVLVRHAESVWNVERRLTGHTDVPLSDLGRAQARALRARLQPLRLDGVWSSDLQRAAETARLVFGEPRTDPRLREIDFGRFEGMRWDELSKDVVAEIRDFTTFAAPGGESFARLRERVGAFLDGLPPGTWAVVAHVGVLHAILNGSCGRVMLPNASAFGWHPGARELLDPVSWTPLPRTS